MSEQGTPRPWRVCETQNKNKRYWEWWVEAGPEDNPLFLGDFYRNREAAGEAVAAVNACERLAPGIPPDQLEVQVRALVRTASPAQKIVDALGMDPDAVAIAGVAERLGAALAPFAHLEES